MAAMSDLYLGGLMSTARDKCTVQVLNSHANTVLGCPLMSINPAIQVPIIIHEGSKANDSKGGRAVLERRC